MRRSLTKSSGGKGRTQYVLVVFYDKIGGAYTLSKQDMLETILPPCEGVWAGEPQHALADKVGNNFGRYVSEFDINLWCL